MTNSNNMILRRLIRAKGYTMQGFANELQAKYDYKISRWYLYWLSNNPSHLKLRDIQAFSKALGLTTKEQSKVFFKEIKVSTRKKQ